MSKRDILAVRRRGAHARHAAQDGAPGKTPVIPMSRTSVDGRMVDPPQARLGKSVGRHRREPGVESAAEPAAESAAEPAAESAVREQPADFVPVPSREQPVRGRTVPRLGGMLAPLPTIGE